MSGPAWIREQLERALAQATELRNECDWPGMAGVLRGAVEFAIQSLPSLEELLTDPDQLRTLADIAEERLERLLEEDLAFIDGDDDGRAADRGRN